MSPEPVSETSPNLRERIFRACKHAYFGILQTDNEDDMDMVTAFKYCPLCGEKL